MSLKKIVELLILVLLIFACFALSIMIYARILYPDADYEQIVITLNHLTPKVIFSALTTKDYILASLFFIVVYPVCYLFLTSKQRVIALFLMIAITFGLTGYPSYYILMHTKTKLYDEHYITPKAQNLTMPEHKKNLILIYLESFEQNFKEAKYYEKNLIPNLSKLQNEGQNVTNFANLPGTTFSIGALVASHCGVPLRAKTIKTDIYQKTHFLPRVVCFPELLKQNGYQTAIIKAADITYTDADVFASSHGYDLAVGFNEIITTYPQKELSGHLGTFDGINDKSLFEYAKQKITEFDKNKPFMLTLFSLDTHAPNIFKDTTCPTIFDDERDAFLCTDKTVADFISWLKNSPYYENTTVVILGDHLLFYPLNKSGKPQRSPYNVFLNLDENLKLNKTKNYSTYDMAPTILESLNIKLENHALGLGRSLFTEEQTLVEQLGEDKLNKALRQKSDTYEQFQMPLKARHGDYLPYTLGTVLNSTEVLTYADVYKEVFHQNYLDTITLSLPNLPKKDLQLKIKFNAVLNHKHSIIISANDTVINRFKGTKYPTPPFELTTDIPRSVLKDNMLKLVFKNDSGTYFVTHMGIVLLELVITEK